KATLLPNRWILSRLAAATSLARDRKSTRLNSSHANISYAVFCLKKKKVYIYDWNDYERIRDMNSLRGQSLNSNNVRTIMSIVLAILSVFAANATHLFFFFNDTAPTEIYTLSLHDALPISAPPRSPATVRWPPPPCTRRSTSASPSP